MSTSHQFEKPAEISAEQADTVRRAPRIGDFERCVHREQALPGLSSGLSWNTRWQVSWMPCVGAFDRSRNVW